MAKSIRTQIAIVLPAYNESTTIAACIREFHRVLPGAQIIVVDNNSSDDTGSVALQTLQFSGISGCVLSERRQGKANAVRRAFLEVDADVYVMADADLTYPVDILPKLLDPVLSGQADMVVGDRLSSGAYARENKRPFHGFGNSLVAWMVNSLFHARLTDIMSGYRVMTRQFVENYPCLVEGFELETDLTLYAVNGRFRVVELPVHYQDRPAGSYSKLNTFTDGAKVIFAIAQILRYYKPFKFFGCLSLLFFLSGLVAAVPVLTDWVRERYIHHLPLAILATGLELVAVLSLAIGLILDSAAYQQRKELEINLRRTGR
jgi:glycosyltransferase involved in cell wall biosynthesis